jgi:hypothetical protein
MKTAPTPVVGERKEFTFQLGLTRLKMMKRGSLDFVLHVKNHNVTGIFLGTNVCST